MHVDVVLVAPRCSQRALEVTRCVRLLKVAAATRVTARSVQPHRLHLPVCAIRVDRQGPKVARRVIDRVYVHPISHASLVRGADLQHPLAYARPGSRRQDRPEGFTQRATTRPPAHVPPPLKYTVPFCDTGGAVARAATAAAASNSATPGRRRPLPDIAPVDRTGNQR